MIPWKRRRGPRLAFTAAVCLSAFGQAPAAEPAAAGTNLVIESGAYPDHAAARRAWRPMGGTSPVFAGTAGGAAALEFPCHFAGTRIERASWDLALDLDLAAAQGVAFEFLCPDASPVSYFSLYFQSGDGWYHASFFPESTNAWQTIHLDKAAFGLEGKPAGWSRLRTLRLSAWRGGNQDTRFFLRHLRPTGALGGDALVAVVRADYHAGRNPGESAGIGRYTETVVELLAASGVGCSVLSDEDLTAARLQLARVVILPHNPELPPAAGQALLEYARAGGRLLVCYIPPDPLRPLFNLRELRHLRETRPGQFAAIRPVPGALPGAPPLARQRSWNIQSVAPGAGGRVLAEWLDEQGQPSGHAAVVGATNWILFSHVLLPDDEAAKRRLLLALVGHLAPEVWAQAARAAVDRIPAVTGQRTFEEAESALRQPGLRPDRAAAELAAARSARQQAVESLRQGRFDQTLDQAAEARARLLAAWCLAQPAAPGEFRAFWCHSAFGVRGLSWEEAIAGLATNGFTAVLPNMLWGGVAYYPSQVLPVAPEVASRGDQLAACLAAARKHGVQVHVWKVNWNLAHNAPAAFVERMRRENRLQADAAGRPESWLCPSHPDNQRLEIESMLEVARNYDVDGLHFDYIRYPDSAHCYCAGCRERFQKASGIQMPGWPGSVLAEGPHREAWLEWRRTNITTVVRAVATRARALKPGLKISAAVFRDWPRDRDTIGQDWGFWCQQGWLDFVCPMNYTTSPGHFESMVSRQLAWTGRVPCYPGIGESASNSRLGVEEVIRQIQIARRWRTGGFVIFNYGVSEAAELLPMLGLGITARP